MVSEGLRNEVDYLRAQVEILQRLIVELGQRCSRICGEDWWLEASKEIDRVQPKEVKRKEAE